MAKATHALIDIETEEVSLVDQGAVKRKFALRKRNGDPMDEAIKRCLDTPLDGEDALEARFEKAGVDKKGQQAIKGALRLLTAFKDSLRPQDYAFLTDLVDGADGEEAEPTKAKAQKAADAAADAAGDIAKAAQEQRDPVENLSPELKARFADITKRQQESDARAVALEKALAEQKELARTREFVEKASREYPNLGPAKELGPVLKSLVDAGLYKSLERVLRGANERAQAESLYKEAGSSESYFTSEDNDNAASRLEKAAHAIAKAENVSVTKATELACSRDPSLYEAYNKAKINPTARGA